MDEKQVRQIARAAASLETELYDWLVKRLKAFPIGDGDEETAAMARMASAQVVLTMGIARLVRAEVTVNGFDAALARLDVVRESAEEFLREHMHQNGLSAESSKQVH